VWGEEQRPVVQHYVLQMKLAQEQVDALRATKEAALVAVSEARAASTKATAALIIAAGAMLAAMAAAFVAFLALGIGHGDGLANFERDGAGLRVEAHFVGH